MKADQKGKRPVLENATTAAVFPVCKSRSLDAPPNWTSPMKSCQGENFLEAHEDRKWPLFEKIREIIIMAAGRIIIAEVL